MHLPFSHSSHPLPLTPSHLPISHSYSPLPSHSYSRPSLTSSHSCSFSQSTHPLLLTPSRPTLLLTPPSLFLTPYPSCMFSHTSHSFSPVRQDSSFAASRALAARRGDPNSRHDVCCRRRPLCQQAWWWGVGQTEHCRSRDANSAGRVRSGVMLRVD